MPRLTRAMADLLELIIEYDDYVQIRPLVAAWGYSITAMTLYLAIMASHGLVLRVRHAHWSTTDRGKIALALWHGQRVARRGRQGPRRASSRGKPVDKTPVSRTIAQDRSPTYAR